VQVAGRLLYFVLYVLGLKTSCAAFAADLKSLAFVIFKVPAVRRSALEIKITGLRRLLGTLVCPAYRPYFVTVWTAGGLLTARIACFSVLFFFFNPGLTCEYHTWSDAHYSCP
jgi:hypothetical protein